MPATGDPEPQSKATVGSRRSTRGAGEARRVEVAALQPAQRERGGHRRRTGGRDVVVRRRAAVRPAVEPVGATGRIRLRRGTERQREAGPRGDGRRTRDRGAVHRHGAAGRRGGQRDGDPPRHEVPHHGGARAGGIGHGQPDLQVAVRRSLQVLGSGCGERDVVARHRTEEGMGVRVVPADDRPSSARSRAACRPGRRSRFRGACTSRRR